MFTQYFQLFTPYISNHTDRAVASRRSCSLWELMLVKIEFHTSTSRVLVQHTFMRCCCLVVFWIFDVLAVATGFCRSSAVRWFFHFGHYIRIYEGTHFCVVRGTYEYIYTLRSAQKIPGSKTHTHAHIYTEII